jgi:hypothetical protein
MKVFKVVGWRGDNIKIKDTNTYTYTNKKSFMQNTFNTQTNYSMLSNSLTSDKF